MGLIKKEKGNAVTCDFTGIRFKINSSKGKSIKHVVLLNEKESSENDKELLTKNYFLAIFNGMNANDISPQNDAGSKRIKRISRLVRYVVLANLVFSVCFFFVSLPGFKLEFPELSVRGFLSILLEALVVFWFWELARLFRFYERGLIFAAEPIRCIKKLGMICLCGWLTMAVLNFLPHVPMQFPKSPPGITLVVTRTPLDPFLSIYPILFGKGIDFGLLVVGGCVVVAAWIMEEGRKMKAEQELIV